MLPTSVGGSGTGSPTSAGSKDGFLRSIGSTGGGSTSEGGSRAGSSTSAGSTSGCGGDLPSGCRGLLSVVIVEDVSGRVLCEGCRCGQSC